MVKWKQVYLESYTLIGKNEVHLRGKSGPGVLEWLVFMGWVIS